MSRLIALFNGPTIHGVQSTLKEEQDEPLSYYHKKTPLGKVLESSDFSFHHIGVIGLGVGTVAAYGKDKDVIDFFELDNDVNWIARNLFSYLRNSKAKTNVILGDGRINLRNVPDGTYDLMIIDAFSGDALPVHLSTTDAILEYKRCLKKNGLLLFNISCRYFNLPPVLFSNASLINAYSVESENDRDDGPGKFISIWVAITWDKDTKNILVSKLGWKEEGTNGYHVMKIRPWTDDYSNQLPVLNLNYLIGSIKYFRPFYWDWDNFSWLKKFKV